MATHAAPFRTEWHENVLVMQLLGDVFSLDSQSHTEVMEQIVPLIESRSAPRLVVDGSRLGRVDSTLVALLVLLWKETTARNGKMVLSALDPEFRSVLHCSKLDTVWDIYASRDEALKAISA